MSGTTGLSRVSLRRSDPSVSVQLSGRYSEAEVSGAYSTTVVRHDNSDYKLNNANNNDTVYL